MEEFKKFPKIGRLASQQCVITEKIDGTNGQIHIEGEEFYAGSKTRVITPGKGTDNHGFARWVWDNIDTLREKLGDGTHYGEWAGQGVQRKYGLSSKVYALFNPLRYPHIVSTTIGSSLLTTVPLLYTGIWSLDVVDDVMMVLRENGSEFVPGFQDPEGVVVYLTGLRVQYKDTFDYKYGKWRRNDG